MSRDGMPKSHVSPLLVIVVPGGHCRQSVSRRCMRGLMRRGIYPLVPQKEPALVGGTRSTLYGNIIELYFGDGANWPLGSAMSVVMLAGVLLLALVISRLVDLRRLVG